jgi:hypothetical protein
VSRPKVDVKIEFDVAKMMGKRAPMLTKAQAKLDVQIIKDSNFFCPLDEGDLQNSAMIASKIGEGELVWDEPYARKQYYEAPNKSKDKNPNARMKWVEAAKVVCLEAWQALIQKEIK